MAETGAAFPNIPFHKVVGMRNRVVHNYGNVDFEIVWETVQTHLPRCCTSSRALQARELRRDQALICAERFPQSPSA